MKKFFINLLNKLGLKTNKQHVEEINKLIYEHVIEMSEQKNLADFYKKKLKDTEEILMVEQSGKRLLVKQFNAKLDDGLKTYKVNVMGKRTEQEIIIRKAQGNFNGNYIKDVELKYAKERIASNIAYDIKNKILEEDKFIIQNDFMVLTKIIFKVVDVNDKY